jgi:glutathione synthase
MATILFLMDPLASINPYKDTTYMLMLGAYTRGHQVYFVGKHDIHLSSDGCLFTAELVIPSEDRAQPFHVSETVLLKEDDVDVVFIRTDPPFDEHYLVNTWLLDRLSPRILVMNSGHGIRTVNEKLWAIQFTDLIPHTLVTSSSKLARDFLKEHHTIVAKPSNGYGGSSVFKLHYGDTNTNVIFETLTKTDTQAIILQAYIRAADVGDKRILLLDGDPVGALLRVHSESDHRNNFFAGGKAQPCDISERDRYIISILKPHLQSLGLLFVGIDIIGDYLIEVNVTSPTCLQEMNALYGIQIEETVILFIESILNKGVPSNV